jgi:hypothetical protein
VLDRSIRLLIRVNVAGTYLIKSIQKLLKQSMYVELISRIIVVIMRICKYIYLVQDIYKFFPIINIKTHNGNFSVERLKDSIVGGLGLRIVHREHKVYDDALGGFSFVIYGFVHDRRRQKDHVTCVDIVGSSFDQVRSIWSQKDQYLVERMQMLELHVVRDTSVVIIDVVVNVIFDIVDDDKVLIIVLKLIIDQHITPPAHSIKRITPSYEPMTKNAMFLGDTNKK